MPTNTPLPKGISERFDELFAEIDETGMVYTSKDQIVTNPLQSIKRFIERELSQLLREQREGMVGEVGIACEKYEVGQRDEIISYLRNTLLSPQSGEELG